MGGVRPGLGRAGLRILLRLALRLLSPALGCRHEGLFFCKIREDPFLVAGYAMGRAKRIAQMLKRLYPVERVACFAIGTVVRRLKHSLEGSA